MPDVRIIPASGSLQFTGSSAADSIHVQYTNSGLNFTNSASLMYISSSGNVGIGTSTPGAQFEIKNTTGGIPTPTITLTTATYNTSIIAGNASYPYALGANSFNIYHAVAGPIGFYNGGASPTLRFSILSDGKVIIGNATSATSQFTVNSLINGTGIELKCSTTANTSYAITHTTAGANTWALNSAGNASSQTAGTLSIGSTTNNMLLFSNGNTVLGASNSSDAGYKLDVNGTTRNQSTITLQNPGSSNYLTFSPSGSQFLYSYKPSVFAGYIMTIDGPTITFPNGVGFTGGLTAGNLIYATSYAVDNSSANRYIRFWKSGVASRASITHTTAGTLQFRMFDSYDDVTGGIGMYIDQSGNVGITGSLSIGSTGGWNEDQRVSITNPSGYYADMLGFTLPYSFDPGVMYQTRQGGTNWNGQISSGSNLITSSPTSPNYNPNYASYISVGNYVRDANSNFRARVIAVSATTMSLDRNIALSYTGSNYSYWPRAYGHVPGTMVYNTTTNKINYWTASSLNILLDSSGSQSITGSLTVTGGITGSITSASFASTASFVNTLNQSVIVTSSMVIGSSSLGPSENTLTLGARDAGGEGGQLGLNASGGTYTSASMLDNYQNQFRILRGSNAGSDALVASWNMHTKQMQLPAYTNASSFIGTATANLAVNSNGDVITVSTTGGTVFPYAGNAVITGSLTTTGIIYAQPNGGMYFQGGDDAALYDINVVNTMGIYGVQDATVGSIKLGSGGGTISGKSGNIGIGTINPTSASFQVNGNVWATSFTGSHFGTSSYATQALSASWAPGGGGSSFPYTGSARITGSLNVIGDTVMTGSLIVSNSLDTSNRNLYTPLNNTALDWSDDTILNSNVYQRDFKSATTQNTVSNTINNAYVSYLGDIIEVDGTYTFIDSGVTDGMLVYLDTDATWYPVSQSSTTATKMIGIAFNVTGGGLNTGFVLLEGHVVINVTLVQSPDHGLPVYIRDNTTTGEMSTVVPTTTGGTQVIRVLGHCYWNNIGDPTQWMMKFRPSNDWILI